MSPDVHGTSQFTRLGSFDLYESWLRLLGRLPRILVAEDDPETRRALEEIFEQSGFDVRAVEDGSALLDRLEPMLLSEPGHWPPDLIMTDVRMPGLDALNIVEELRDVGWETPVIVITGYGGPDVERRIDELPHARYFEKPLDAERLDRAVRESIYEARGEP